MQPDGMTDVEHDDDPEERFGFSRTALARLMVAHQQYELAVQAGAGVPTTADDYAEPGEMVAEVVKLADLAEAALTCAVVYERQKGTSWEQIGQALGGSAASRPTSATRPPWRSGSRPCWSPTSPPPPADRLPVGPAAARGRAAAGADRPPARRLGPRARQRLPGRGATGHRRPAPAVPREIRAS
jgi:hypothetical protein